LLGEPNSAGRDQRKDGDRALTAVSHRHIFQASSGYG
jgi:hypothetical protein